MAEPIQLPEGAGSVISAIVGGLLGWLGGRRGRAASASVDEATAERIRADVYSQVTRDLGDQLRRCEEGRERDQHRIEELETCRDELRDQVAQLLQRVAHLERGTPAP